MNPIFDLVRGLLSPITTFVTNWQKRKEAKLVAELAVAEAQTLAKIKRLETGQKADIAWENLSITNSGWKDEWFTIILSIPAILVFIPGMDVYVYKGFEALKNCPEWYNWMLGIAVGSAFGYRKIADFMRMKKGD
jgi:hypothetical protein